MYPRSRFIASALAGSILTLASMFASATVAEGSTGVVVQSTDFGTLSLPYTNGFSLTLAPAVTSDSASNYFVSDYGLEIDSNGALSSAVVTFDLGSVLQLSNLQVSLLQGTRWLGSVPATLTADQVADIQSRVLFTGTGGGAIQAIDAMPLAAGDYVIEVTGQTTGSAGGSYAGILNVAAVPEPAGIALMMSSVLLLAVAKRRARG